MKICEGALVEAWLRKHMPCMFSQASLPVTHPMPLSTITTTAGLAAQNPWQTTCRCQAGWTHSDCTATRSATASALCTRTRMCGARMHI